jgi:hypothetical protein
MVAQRPDRIGGTAHAFRNAVDDNLDAALDHATQVGTADDILP